MKKIKYLSYYAQKDDKQERSYVLAATNKMDYLCKALNNIGYSVEIVSASYTRNKKHSYSGSYKKLEGTNTLRMFYTFPWGTKFQKLLSIISMNFFIWSDLVFKTKKNETVLVYHSLGYMNAICFAHKIRKFKLILEVEEIYADVLENKVKRKKEINFIKTADAYIFPTELLNGLLNKEEKPYCTIHGTYQVEHKRKSVFNDGKIHVVYAGTFDSRKGGAAAAAAAAQFLPENYHIHILGFGNQQQVKDMQDLIEKLTEECKCTITYDGLKSGEEYIQFIQSCDIGLSTQNPDAVFNSTSFPSKILSYMANGLRVVSIRIPAIEGSAVGAYMYYYDEQTPELIAKSIMQVNMADGYDGRKIISKLDERFHKVIKEMIMNVSK